MCSFDIAEAIQEIEHQEQDAPKPVIAARIEYFFRHSTSAEFVNGRAYYIDTHESWLVEVNHDGVPNRYLKLPNLDHRVYWDDLLANDEILIAIGLFRGQPESRKLILKLIQPDLTSGGSELVLTDT